MAKRTRTLLVLSCLLLERLEAFAPLSRNISARTLSSSSLQSASVDEDQAAIDTKQAPQQVRQRNDGTGKFDMNDWKWCYTSNVDLASTAYRCDDIEGKVPADLCGTLFRNGPANFERGGRRYEHTLDGDGFVASFKFGEDGTVDYRGKFVETEYFVKEQEADKVLFRNTFGTQRDGGILANVLDVKLKNVANTNAVSFGDRLFALWEAGKPYELDPATLETVPDSSGAPFEGLGKSDSMRGVTIDNGGIIDQVANVGRAFTAHPHQTDDDTLAAFSWAQEPVSKTMTLQFSEYDKEWNVKNTVPYEMKDCPLAPHDFAFSKDYYGFFENSMSFDISQFLMGAKGPAQILMQNLEKPCKLHFVPRGSKDAIQVDVPDFFCIHCSAQMVENEQDGTLKVFSSGWDLRNERYFPKGAKEVPFLGSWGGEYPNFDVIPPSTLFRTTVDMATGDLLDHSAVIPGLYFEHPHTDPRDPTVIYGPCSNVVGLSTAPSGYCRIDTKTNEINTWWSEARVFTEEVVVVPKRDEKTKELRDGCWLLGVLHDAERKRSSLAIVDGDDIERGPICRIHLKHPLAYSLHGTFAPS